MLDLEVQRLDLNNAVNREKVSRFLEGFGLILDKDVEYTAVIKDSEDNIKATCSRAGNVFKCFAVSEELRGENITSTLVSHLIDEAFSKGIYHVFIFTKYDKVKVFQACGFKLLYETKEAALLEQGIYDINKYLDKLSKKYNIDEYIEKAALVMNCNPFTLGHRYLIEKAAEENKQVLVFIVEEDKSLFPFEMRYKLVKKGVEDLKNVRVVPGGEYIISSATFPTYFIREEDVRLKAYSTIDAGVFGKYFCKKFNIKTRYVGDEPYCKVTSAYNIALNEILPNYDVKVKIINRKKQDSEFISASKVRNLIKENKLSDAEKLLPKVTMDFLSTEEGKKIVEKIKISNYPH